MSSPKEPSVAVECVDGSVGFYGHTFRTKPEGPLHEYLISGTIRDASLDEPGRRGFRRRLFTRLYMCDTSCDEIRASLESAIRTRMSDPALEEVTVLTTDQRWRREDYLFTE